MKHSKRINLEQLQIKHKELIDKAINDPQLNQLIKIL